jgi:hypothetical protein
MVNPGYQFTLKDKKRSNNDVLLITHIYTFKNRKNQRYIVNVENYRYNFFVIKFHLKSDTYSKNKYCFQTNTFDAFRILSTCFNILYSIFEKNKLASFGFLCMPSKNEIIKENKQNKRYRIYRLKALNYFSGNDFIHIENPIDNAYIIINKHNPEIDLQNKIINMIIEYYDCFH